MSDIRSVESYAELANEKADLEEKLEAIDAKLKDLTQPVLDYFARHGLDRLTVQGRTLYPRRDIYAGRMEGVSPEEAAEVLKKAGLDEFVKEAPVMQSLSAFFREREKRGEAAVPMGLATTFVANETWKVGSRRG